MKQFLFEICRHKTRLHIGQLVKDTSAKLKQASEIDHNVEVNVMRSTLIEHANCKAFLDLFCFDLFL